MPGVRPLTLSAMWPFDYTEDIGGQALWTERHRGLEVIDGRFVAVLGSITPSLPIWPVSRGSLGGRR